MTELFSQRNLNLNAQHKFDLDQLFKTKMKSINDANSFYSSNVNASPSSTNSQTMLTNSSFSSSSSSSPTNNINVSDPDLNSQRLSSREIKYLDLNRETSRSTLMQWKTRMTRTARIHHLLKKLVQLISGITQRLLTKRLFYLDTWGA